jgi:pyruvate formate-lyase activating enzyme-like uncharacterized protein
MAGTWSCAFISANCTTACFFCPGELTTLKRGSVIAEHAHLSGAREYAEYINRFGFKGVSFSGGEPLIEFDKVIEYIVAIKTRCAQDVYLWLYTNGDLVNSDKLLKLKAAGLNEIRFNISARNYDLGPVKCAIGVIDTVTVEIPAIPEDVNKVKKVIPELARIGVDFMNLQQMYTFPANSRAFMERGYTMPDGHLGPIPESEIAALEILAYAARKNSKLPIHYCSDGYKQNIQLPERRKRIARLLTSGWHGFTDRGFVRVLYITGPSRSLRNVVECLREQGCPPEKWSLNAREGKLLFHWQLLKHISVEDVDFNVAYDSPVPMSRPGKGPSAPVRLRNVVRLKRMSRNAMFALIDLYERKRGLEDAMRSFHHRYEVRTRRDIQKMCAERDALIALQEYEGSAGPACALLRVFGGSKKSR